MEINGIILVISFLLLFLGVIIAGQYFQKRNDAREIIEIRDCIIKLDIERKKGEEIELIAKNLDKSKGLLLIAIRKK